MSDAFSLPSPADMAQALRSRLDGWADIQWVHATGSTNTDLLGPTRAGAPLPRLLGTHLQHQGRGRANRNFQTAAGDALMFSCALEVALPIAALPTLSVLLGLVACETLASRLAPGHRLCLKWPNDLQWGEAKLAGILTESAAALDANKPRLVVGIGINLRGAQTLSTALGRNVADWQTIASESSAAMGDPVRQSDHELERYAPPQAALDGGAQAPAHRAGVLHSPVELCAAIAAAWRAELAHTQTAWVANSGLPLLPARFALHDALAGKAVTVQDQGRILIEGVADGVTADGRLQLRTATGLQTVTVGDISVRPEPTAALP